MATNKIAVEQATKIRQERRAKGLCCWCDRKPAKGTALCASHLARMQGNGAKAVKTKKEMVKKTKGKVKTSRRSVITKGSALDRLVRSSAKLAQVPVPDEDRFVALISLVGVVRAEQLVIDERTRLRSLVSA